MIRYAIAKGIRFANYGEYYSCYVGNDGNGTTDLTKAKLFLTRYFAAKVAKRLANRDVFGDQYYAIQVDLGKKHEKDD